MKRKTLNEIIVNGKEYVLKQSIENMKLRYVIVRAFGAGVFAGYLESEEGERVVLRNARRLWKWEGAASISQLAMEGVKNPENCRFPCEVKRVILLKAFEICEATEEAKKSIAEVKIWEAK